MWFRILILMWPFWAAVPGADTLPPENIPFTQKLQAADTAQEKSALTICSFCIPCLGVQDNRYHRELARVLARFDIAVIQGLAVPPYKGYFPDGDIYDGSPPAAEFFGEMERLGFQHQLAAEPTGPGSKSRRDDCTSEWPVVFYRNTVRLAPDLPSGFIALTDKEKKKFYRVPYTHGFRTADSSFDFVLINVHLHPNPAGKSKWKNRLKELRAVLAWVYDNQKKEKDFIILGNLNIRDGKELYDVLPEGFESLNDELDITAYFPEALPNDHIFYRPLFSLEMDSLFDQKEFPLLESMMPKWKGPGGFPGSPSEGRKFGEYFSEHKLIFFRMQLPSMDDD